MPAYKDQERNTWYASFYYTDWTGKKRLKKKRGFKKKSEAQQFERDFLAAAKSSPEIPFHILVSNYMEYSKLIKKNRKGTLRNKQNIMDTHILPFFYHKKVNEITPNDIIEWQKELLSEDSNYKPTYLRTLNSKLSAIFNYGVTFYNLDKNPCLAAGFIGNKKPETISFWTLEEYTKFIEKVDKPRARVGLQILYWGGLRIGELLALTLLDYDAKRHGFDINKSWDIFDGVEEIGPPKTDNGYRFVDMPEFVCKEMETYISMLYELPEDERIFESTSKYFFANEIGRCSAKAGVKDIRVHDLRHSHVSLLIDLGYSDYLIADRIGDTVQQVRETYGHLFPERRGEVAKRLNEFGDQLGGNVLEAYKKFNNPNLED